MNPQTTRITFTTDCDSSTVASLLDGWVVTVYDFLGSKLAEGEVYAGETDDDGLFLLGGLDTESVYIPWRDVANIEIA